jgi:Ca2+-binding RTX toxin-like protein
LTGGGGSDVFVYRHLNDARSSEAPGASAALDSIADFATGPAGDVLDIAHFLENSTTYGNGAGGAISAFVRTVVTGGDTQVQIDVDGSAGPSVFETIVILTGVEATLDQITLDTTI